MARRSSLTEGACGTPCSARSSSPRYRWSSAAWRVAKKSARRPGAGAGNRDHAGWVSVAAPIFPVRAVLPCVPVLCAPPAADACLAVVPAAAGFVAATARGQDMHAVAVAAAVRSAHQASGHIPRAVIVAPGVGLEFVAADAAGADHGLASVPAVAGVVDAFCRLLDDRHLLDPAAQLGRGAVVADAGTGNVQVSGGGGVAAPGTAARDERQGYAREQGNQGHGGREDNDQARRVHGSGPPSRICRALAGPGGSALRGVVRWAGSRISS